MSSKMYPNLGFNPCPGSPEHAAGFATALKKAKEAVDEAHQLVGKMQTDTTQWRGAGGRAFAEHLKGRVDEDLMQGYQSLSRAADVMIKWSHRLQGYWDRAHALEREAAEANAAYDDGITRNEAQRQRYERSYGTPDEAGAAAAVEQGMRAVDDARQRLDDVRKRAEKLRDEYEEDAKHAAGRLEDAADFAAKEVTWWDQTKTTMVEKAKSMLPQAGNSFAENAVKVTALTMAPIFPAAPAVASELFGSGQEPVALRGAVTHKSAQPSQLTTSGAPAAAGA